MANDALMRIILEAQDKGSAILKRFGGELFGVGKIAGPVAIAVGAVSTAATTLSAVIIANTRAVAANVDEQAKFALRLGTTAGVLSEYHFAAERSGVSASDMNNMLEQMNRRLGTAADRGGPAADVIRALGLDIHALIDLRADEQFEAIAEALSHTTDQSVRSAQAYELFGRQGMAVNQLLADGIKGFRDLRDEGRRLGVTISTDLARDSQVFQDRLTDISTISTGLRQNLAEETLPAINEGLQKLVEFASDPSMQMFLHSLGAFAGKTTEIVISISSGVLEAVGWLAKMGLQSTGPIGAGLIAGLEAASEAMDDVREKAAAMNAEIGGGGGTAAMSTAGGSSFRGSDDSRWERFVDQMHELRAAFDALGPPITDQIEHLLAYEERLDAVGEAFDRNIAQTGLNSMGMLVRGMGSAVGNAIAHGEKLGDALKAMWKQTIAYLTGQIAILIAQMLIASTLAAFLRIGNVGAANNVLSMFSKAGLVPQGLSFSGNERASGGTGPMSGLVELAGRAQSRTMTIEASVLQIPGGIDQQDQLATMILSRGRELGMI